MKKTQSITTNFKLEDSQYWRGSDLYLLPNKTYTLVIDYPFDEERRYSFKTAKGRGMGLLGLIKKISECYDETYDDADENGNGYWHSIEDLVIEGIRVDHVKRIIRLDVGS